jgi:CheY-like chemotaxis protein
MRSRASASSSTTLILLDLMMPELDGFGFLRGLRARPDWRDIPVVVSPSSRLDEAAQGGGEVGEAELSLLQDAVGLPGQPAAVVGARRPGLILLDLMMPELDGFGFLRGLRARPDWRDIRASPRG